MKKELKNFIIESDFPHTYFNDIIDYIISNEKRILNFFNLEKLPNKVRIILLSYEPFKNFIISKYGEILNYISADSDSPTNTIRILNVEDQIKHTTHKDANVDKIKKTVLHEIVHQCHHTYHMDYNQITWFAEGLATNLSNQDYTLQNLDKCDFDKLKKDFRHYKGGYKFSYTIINYILSNYSDEEIYKLYSNPNYLREKADFIFEEAKKWTKEKH
ncbi:MAG: hypothetical protein IKG27_02380 [Bacilli bacterium]|nr:hypothetical protein [Bacilli bacterium]